MATFTIDENYGTYKGNTSYILDGDTSNCWQANNANSTGKYVLITSDKNINVSTVVYTTTNSSEIFKSGTWLQYSTDNSNWVDIGEFNGSASVTFNVNATCKYLRIYCKSGSGYVSISELAITYTEDGGDTPTPSDGTFTGSPTNSSYTGISSGSNRISQAVGKTAENPATSTSAWYGSNSATVDSQYAQYTFDLSSIPENAIDIQVKCKVAGTAENTTYTHQSGGRYSVWGLCCNGTAKGSQIYTTSRNVTVVEFTNTGSWTREELNNLQLRHYVGYYGGTTNGATLTITYKVPSEESTNFYIKVNGAYKGVKTVYKKVNGAYEQIEVSSLDTNVNYVFKGN